MNPDPAYTGRFAPSPTGPLHFGSLVAALASWLDARAAGGRWRVRMEDLDRPRCVPGAADTILRQLENYGLTWDGAVLAQSARDAAYADALQSLREAGAVYACACSRSRLAGAPRNREGEMVYPGICRSTPPSKGSACAWRVRVPNRVIAFSDRVHGALEQNLATDVGDFVVKRADGLFAYQLAVVADDAFQGITDVVRGADLLWNTPRQIWLQTLLGLPAPRYAHVPLMIHADGQKLSKQSLAPALPAQGRGRVLTEALSRLDHAPPVELHTAPPAELLDWARHHWQIDRLSKQPVLANRVAQPDNSPPRCS